MARRRTDAGYQAQANAEYDNGYDVEADGYGYGYYQRPIPYERARHERRAAMARMPHDQMHGVNSDMPATVYDRYDTGRDMSGATDHRGAGYNGHDRHMFDGQSRTRRNRPRPITKAATTGTTAATVRVNKTGKPCPPLASVLGLDGPVGASRRRRPVRLLRRGVQPPARDRRDRASRRSARGPACRSRPV